MEQYLVEFSVGEEVIYKNKYYAVVNSISITNTKRGVVKTYFILMKEHNMYVDEKDLSHMFKEDMKAIVKINGVFGLPLELTGLIMSIDENDPNCFYFQIGEDGQYIKCYKSDIVKYIIED